MRERPSVLHVDADSFFAAVEMVSKPSIRNRQVLVGGTGPRGVVATANYAARARGAHSAMPMVRARQLCPDAVVLTPRFGAYVAYSQAIMSALRELSPLVEQLGLDEAFVDLDGGDTVCPDPVAASVAVRARVRQLTGLAVSAGLGRSKMVAKLASDAAKPDGLLTVEPAGEDEFLLPLPVNALWGVGPATESTLERVAVRTVADLRSLTEPELVNLLGRAHGGNLYRMARGLDDRLVEPVREVKSVGAERTFPSDVAGRDALLAALERVFAAAMRRLHRHGGAARTVVVKVRFADFDMVTRSVTLPQAAADPAALWRAATHALELAEVTQRVRLLGVSFHNLSAHEQLTLALDGAKDTGAEDTGADGANVDGEDDESEFPVPLTPTNAAPGLDVEHPTYGRGWLAGLRGNEVTVRFESALTGPGVDRVFDIRRAPLQLVEPAGPAPLPT